MEDESSFKTGGSLVFACADKVMAKPFLEAALQFLTKVVLPLPSVSMEIVVTSDYTVICTFMFYDTFIGEPEDFVQQLRDDAKTCNIQCVADGCSDHDSWFSAASQLCPSAIHYFEYKMCHTRERVVVNLVHKHIIHRLYSY